MPRWSVWTGCATADYVPVQDLSLQLPATSIEFASINHRMRINMEHAQLIQAAASIAGGMAAAHYDKFSGLVATRITDIAETAVKIARAIEVEARKQP
jgi:hypothetical protein